MAKKTSRSVSGAKAAKGRKAYRAVPRAAQVPTIVVTDRGKSLRLRERLGMNRETFARLLPISSRSLASIEAGTPPQPPVTRQLKELTRVVDALGEVIQKDAIGPWLMQPNDAFDGLKPIEIIERGEVGLNELNNFSG